MKKLTWQPIIDRAAKIASEYDTRVTLRQLHYRLVAEQAGGYENTSYCYTRLSDRTAEARRDGQFPQLADLTRSVERPDCFNNPEDAQAWLRSCYRRDRTEGQKFQVWVFYEKATLGEQIRTWLDPYGIPSAAMPGYSSQSLEFEIFEEMQNDGRDVIAFYVGDLDPEGEDIERNFLAQVCRAWDEILKPPFL